MLPPDVGLAELHTHLGGSVASDIMWSLAHEQGIALPVKDYWEFDALVTVSDPRGVESLDELDAIYHWTELIQSSPLAVERSVHAAIGGAYRSQRITTLEVRFNPMKRNRGGERDLDHIILAAIRGLDLARLEYPQVRAGLILMMDRTFDARQNEIIVDKAVRWASRGVVGVDIAGPRPGGLRYDYTQVAPMVETARAAGLGVTIHVGEEGATGAEEIGEVVESLRPDRIGHGILAAGDPDLMALIREADVTLEICPTSNLLTKALARRGRGPRDVPPLRRARRAVHDRHGRARDDADAPPRRVRAPPPDRRARRGRARARERARPRGCVRRSGRALGDRQEAAEPASCAASARLVLRVAELVRRVVDDVRCLVPGIARGILRLVDHRLGLVGDVAGGVLRPSEELVEESHGRDHTRPAAAAGKPALRAPAGAGSLASGSSSRWSRSSSSPASSSAFSTAS